MGRSLSDVVSDALNDEVEVDFSGATGGGFGPIPSGDYRAFVDESVPGFSHAKMPKLVLRFRICDGEENAGRVFFRHCPTQGKGSGILRDTLKALGFDVDNMTGFKPGDALNKEAIISIGFQKGHSADNPDPDLQRQEIKKVKPVPAQVGAKSRSSRLG